MLGTNCYFNSFRTAPFCINDQLSRFLAVQCTVITASLHKVSARKKVEAKAEREKARSGKITKQLKGNANELSILVGKKN